MTVMGFKRKIALFLTNKIFAGTRCFEIKRKLLNRAGFELAQGVKIVAPIFCTAALSVGENTWIGRNFTVNGNGEVSIGKNCDIAPDVHIQTGGHETGNSERRAGKGMVFSVRIGSGCWLGARSTVLGGVTVGNGSVIAACACVCEDVEENVLVGGVPARKIKDLSDDKRAFEK